MTTINTIEQEIGLIFACDQASTIGIVTDAKPYGTLPWTKQKGDMRHFMNVTKNSVVIMGKNTWLSIGRPLNGRFNIIVSSSLNVTDIISNNKLSERTGLTVCRSLENALEQAKEMSVTFGYKNIYFIGGKSVYDFALGHVNTVHKTVIHHVFSPEEDCQKIKFDILTHDSSVEIISSETFPADTDNEYVYTVMKLRRMDLIGLCTDHDD